MTAVEELESLNAAIAAITGGAQEYQIGSRRLRRPDLGRLLDERRRLEAKVAQEAGHDVAVAYFDRR